MRGRPTKLTPALARTIADAVRQGVPLTVAGESVKVAASTLLEWLARGEDRVAERPATDLYADFAESIKKARADDQARRLARLEQAATGGAVLHRKTITKPDGTVVIEEKYTEPQWTADAWHLERSDPDHWARKERHEVTGKDGGPLTVLVIGGASMEAL